MNEHDEDDENAPLPWWTVLILLALFGAFLWWLLVPGLAVIGESE